MPVLKNILSISRRIRCSDLEKDLPIRKNPRLEGYDYSKGGGFFITVCAETRKNILSEICRGDPCGRPQIKLTELGKVAEKVLKSLEDKYDIILDEYVIMPDHIHFLIFIKSERATARVAPTLGRIVGAYKSIVANEWRKTCNNRGESPGKLWQRNYYEHIIRNRQDFEEIKRYIFDNPEKRFFEKV